MAASVRDFSDLIRPNAACELGRRYFLDPQAWTRLQVRVRRRVAVTEYHRDG